MTRARVAYLGTRVSTVLGVILSGLAVGLWWAQVVVLARCDPAGAVEAPDCIVGANAIQATWVPVAGLAILAILAGVGGGHYLRTRVTA